jgi:hypothetical protein
VHIDKFDDFRLGVLDVLVRVLLVFLFSCVLLVNEVALGLLFVLGRDEKLLV